MNNTVKWTVRVTFLAAAAICFVLTPLGLFVGIMATDAGLTLTSVAFSILIMGFLPSLGIGFIMARKWLEANPAYMPIGVFISCIIVAGLVWHSAQHFLSLEKLPNSLRYLWASFL